MLTITDKPDPATGQKDDHQIFVATHFIRFDCWCSFNCLHAHNRCVITCIRGGLFRDARLRARGRDGFQYWGEFTVIYVLHWNFSLKWKQVACSLIGYLVWLNGCHKMWRDKAQINCTTKSLWKNANDAECQLVRWLSRNWNCERFSGLLFSFCSALGALGDSRLLFVFSIKYLCSFRFCAKL